jgi:4-aminobutyrate aminotransferase-like enzyme/Ser/Thr protein kinase RdoA (MazF antagonist)
MTDAGVMHAAPPDFTPEQAADLAARLYGVSGDARPLVSERDQNFALTDAHGAVWVLKVSNAAEDPAVVEMEVAAIEHVAGADPSLPVPRARPTVDGPLVGSVEADGRRHLVRLLPLLPGRNAEPRELSAGQLHEIGLTTGRLSHALRGFFHPAAGRVIEWDQKHMALLLPNAALVEEPERRELLEAALARFAQRVAPALPRLRAQVIHNDVTLDNLLLDADGGVSGIIDFGDMAHTGLVLDVPATLQSLVRERTDIFDVAAAFLAGYTSVVPLERAEAELLGDLLAGRMLQTVLISVWRTRRYPDNAYITGWEEPAWELLRQLQATGWDESSERLAALALAPTTRASSGFPPPTDDLLGRRRSVLGSALAPLSYRRPLHLVRGAGAWLYDVEGKAYLDAYNNVPVVGHAHPRVADAIARQAATLNTNTRYLHGAVVELAERLAHSLPAELDTIMFVNSGSEANDVAWRLAKVATGNDGVLVTDWAYHGVTAAIDDMSPSEWHGRHPDHVETLPAPDTFRPSYAAPPDPRQARSAVQAAVGRLAGRGHPPAALYLDAMFTSDGIFAPDPQVVAALLQEARAAGALLVADEVQAGHGRSGDGLWSFPRWGVVPDVVTMGKPMGNGHPVAAVATRSELADRFAATTEFFSTFGGNPVASLAALAVLDVVDDEALVANAARVGARLREQLSELQPRHRSIQDVRGRGLMTGVELADPQLAARVRDAMRERGVLIGTTRREGNVLKIRPPLCITQDEAGIIVRTLDEVLGTLAS